MVTRQAEVPRPMLMDGRKMMIRAYDALALKTTSWNNQHEERGFFVLENHKGFFCETEHGKII